MGKAAKNILLLIAAARNKTEVVCYLLKKSANPRLKGFKNQQPIDLTTCEDIRSMLRDAMEQANTKSSASQLSKQSFLRQRKQPESQAPANSSPSTIGNYKSL